MSEAARCGVGVAPAHRWHNPIPLWILQDETYVALTRRNPAYARILQAICDTCDRPDEQGSLVGAFRSGRAFARAANVATSTFWKGVAELVAHGVVVVLANGGTVRLPHRTINASNTYGVPGHKGALDHRAVRREFRQVQVDADGCRRAVRVHAGDQATLWHRDLFQRAPSDRGRPLIGQGVSAHRTGGVRSSDTTITTPSPAQRLQSHGHGASRSRRRRRCPHIVDVEQLRHVELGTMPGYPPPPPALAALYVQCREIGLADNSEAGWIRFVAAAFAAVRDGREPRALFASMVNSGAVRSGEQLYVTLEDEDAAVRLIKRHRERHGESQ